ncbi:urease accessory protein UreH [Paenibacillus sp. PL2-23]|uniref:HoxN/HupN/NixA family nickel/cobalt transporter n=1 Tax=Paenibacillus sp. PL2-23 TaxID=2100729 RepID=UPI0030FB3467
MISLLSLLFLGFILGIKHAIEPDHIIAVSTMVGKHKKLLRSTLTGVFWGIGHTATLFVVGMLLVLLKGELSDSLAMSLEFLVGIMLVYLGAKNLIPSKGSFASQKGDVNGSMWRVTIIGFVHGLAGSAALVILTLSTVSSIWECALYILVFGIGTITGMLVFTTILGIPFVYGSSNKPLSASLTRIAGTVSFVFGLYYMYNLGITEGLFDMWLGRSSS